jgi:hypothetical protein
MNPAPGLLTDWITIPGFLWLILGCIAVAILVILTCNIVRVWEEDDAANEDAQDEAAIPYRCAVHGCSWHLAEGDRVYVCGVCGARVIRDADVYDQESGVA